MLMRIMVDCRDQLISIPRAQSVQYYADARPHSNLLTTIHIIIITIIFTVKWKVNSAKPPDELLREIHKNLTIILNWGLDCRKGGKGSILICSQEHS